MFPCSAISLLLHGGGGLVGDRVWDVMGGSDALGCLA